MRDLAAAARSDRQKVADGDSIEDLAVLRFDDPEELPAHLHTAVREAADNVDPLEDRGQLAAALGRVADYADAQLARVTPGWLP
jgi:S1-C subfamily serine protease